MLFREALNRRAARIGAPECAPLSRPAIEGLLRPACVRVSRRMEVLALSRELLYQLLQLCHATLSRTDGHAILAARVAAGLAGIEPVLKRAGQQAVCDIPEIRVLVAVGQPVAEVHGLGEGRIEGVRDLCHGAGV